MSYCEYLDLIHTPAGEELLIRPIAASPGRCIRIARRRHRGDGDITLAWPLISSSRYAKYYPQFYFSTDETLSHFIEDVRAVARAGCPEYFALGGRP